MMRRLKAYIYRAWTGKWVVLSADNDCSYHDSWGDAMSAAGDKVKIVEWAYRVI